MLIFSSGRRNARAETLVTRAWPRDDLYRGLQIRFSFDIFSLNRDTCSKSRFVEIFISLCLVLFCLFVVFVCLCVCFVCKEIN